MTWSRRTVGIFSAIDVTTSAAIPIGMLIQKIHCHPGPPVSHPPSSGPATLETPNTAAK